MTTELMKAIPVFVVHLEDPAGSGLAACNGVAFEPVHAHARHGDTLWMCTGCAVVARRADALRNEYYRYQRMVAELRDEMADRFANAHARIMNDHDHPDWNTLFDWHRRETDPVLLIRAFDALDREVRKE